jgi:hypothetical protein
LEVVLAWWREDVERLASLGTANYLVRNVTRNEIRIASDYTTFFIADAKLGVSFQPYAELFVGVMVKRDSCTRLDFYEGKHNLLSRDDA